MSRDHLIALDLGTTGVRALVVHRDGRVLARPYQSLGIRFPSDGRVEQDPNEMWERSVDVVRVALHESKLHADDIAGLGVVTQRATVVAWNRRTLEPVGPAIGWQDQRTFDRVQGFKAAGIPINTMASATKIEWLIQNDAEIQKALSSGELCLGTPDSWLTAKLTNGDAYVTDPANASCTALFNPSEGDWAEPLLNLFSVPKEVLPKVVPTNAIVADTPANLFGAAISVAARTGDQMAAAFGLGVHNQGDAKLTLGTSAMVDLHTGDDLTAPEPGTYPLALWTLVDGTRGFCLEGTVITAAAAVDWFAGLGFAKSAAGLSALAETADSSDGICFVPALQGLGTPTLDEHARGLMLGLTRGSGPAAMARAVFEGVAQRVIDVCDALVLKEAPLRVDGGLARSDFLMQRIADFGGRPLERAAETETTALGAAYLAGLSCGVFENVEACRQTTSAPTRFDSRIDAYERERWRGRWQEALARAAFQSS